ncbi:MAG: Tex family protein [Thermodesulfobacteriota bacterium]|nr:Tex family protein [Thermodesulfobacteriota bacterium]
MNEAHIKEIAFELDISPQKVKATAHLLEQDATVPFIARYRKEVTGSLDEVKITSIRDRLNQLAELDKRRMAIMKSLAEQNKLTDELKEKIEEAKTITLLEDIYLPFRPKRRTRATMARERGLETLASLIFEQRDINLFEKATAFIDQEKGIKTEEEALAGARDIIAEWVNEDQDARKQMRSLFAKKGVIKSRVIQDMEEQGLKYRDYFDWEESVTTVPSHRMLAMLRGEKEGFLVMDILPPEGDALALLESLFVKDGESDSSIEVKKAVHDSYKRLLKNAMETEIRTEKKERADEEAIKVFADNVRELLLASPLGQKNVLAIDPGYRTGCKVVCLDPQGKLVHTDTIYPLTSKRSKDESAHTVRTLCERFHIEAVAIGNGTGGRETETFIMELNLGEDIMVIMVNESGASVYSASEVAREEFPDEDVTVRGAVSIGRRLMDPLAELVKIDPKSIGVGQYQHDVNQRALRCKLSDVVISCVNGVGVEVNTASKELLTYVSGLGPHLARNIIKHRDENGPFPSKESIKKVPRLGYKAFEQAAGFLRIRNGEHPLDASAVHPESYPIVYAMANDLGCKVEDLLEDSLLRKKIDKEQYITEKVGLPTLNDIVEELARPGRDPRKQFETFSFAKGIEKIEDIEPGMKVPGIVTNVTAFGAFVDIGVHQDGLVHISELSNHFIKDPKKVVKVNDKIEVIVLDVDIERGRISLSMKNDPSMMNNDTIPKGKTVPNRDIGKKGSKKNRTFSNTPFIDALRNKKDV